ncbi:branched-chain amino acid ABC transporter permease [Ferrovibrio sp.]|uniref:branched-chain amino acid ABC transporter permease n=1 Tax=Ferrovibrio sp. TaxID=1917215 RepID=UPI000CBFC210|nr:branched-chain amino acid ABC transporter permease [Ferrovibrio sp.]PJI40267.1 MAG: branched-chain amino acid ABC transporter permease [Ferrovibrio sp.]
MSSASNSSASTATSSRLTFVVGLALLGFLGLIPVLSVVFDDPFLLTLFTRIVIMAIAAVSLNLILGYGGMVSFGHAAYIGVGGYTVGILAFHGVHAAWIQWPLAVIISGVVAALIGLLSLRTKGIFFIMITLAFSQLVYYLGNGAFAYGGDDGLNIMTRSDFGGLLNLDNRPTFYYLCWVILLASIYFVHRTVNSRFGMVLQGARSNDRRMATIGFPVHRYQLTAFVIAGMLCGLAGVLTATFTGFISPAMMHWSRSGDLIVMVVLGGMGSLFGPVFGTVAFLLLEEVLSSWTEYWKIVFGPILILVVLFARGGIDGAMVRGQACTLLAGCAAFFLLYGIHTTYEDQWLIPTLILVAACALAWFAKWEIQRRKNRHD